MENIGSTMVVLGILAIVLDFFNYVPKVLFWIYEWGDGVAWGIKIALIVVGGLLWLKIDQAENILPHIEYDEKNKPLAVYISAQSDIGLDLLLDAIRQRLKNELLHITLKLAPQEGKLRHALYSLDCIQHESVNDNGEWLLAVRLEKTEWLKLVKRFPKLNKNQPHF